jgi:hypothetical protein
MAASFPASVKSFTVKTDGVDDVQADHINDLQNEVTAIETELGSDPAGNHATVVERLDTVDTGWVKDATAWVRTAETTFTRAGATANLFPKGAKLRWKENGGAYRYAYAVGLSGTTITTAGDTLTNGTTITDMAISYAATPQGFPDWFNWAPEYSASGSMTFTGVITSYALFKVAGREVRFTLNASGTTGGTAANTITFSLPVNSVDSSGVFACSALDVSLTSGVAFLNSTTACSVRKYDASNWGLGSSKVFSVQGFYRI